TPVFEYQNATESISRVVNGQIDIGAHEFGTPSITNFISSGNYFSIYPNPSDGKFYLENIFSGTVKIEIYNPVGEMVYSIESAEQKINIDFENESSGIYFLKIKSGHEVFFKKIIKQ
ncbi:MAG: T9SS type A sorting domain-containing protein, partial [Bacteroidota bacterium]